MPKYKLLELAYTKGKDLPKKLVLDPIGKNFVFLGTHLFKTYQILEAFYNWQVKDSFPRHLPEIGKF